MEHLTVVEWVYNIIVHANLIIVAYNNYGDVQEGT